MNKATLTVAAPIIALFSGQPIPAFTPTYTGFVNGETSSVLKGTPSLATTATPSSPVGNAYPITVALGTLSSSNYSFSFQNGGAEIAAPANIVLTIPSIGGSTYTATITSNYATTSVIGCAYSAATIAGSGGFFNVSLNPGGKSAQGTIDVSSLPSGFYDAACSVTATIPLDSSLRMLIPTAPAMEPATITTPATFSVGSGSCNVYFVNEPISPEQDEPPSYSVHWTANYSVTINGQQVNQDKVGVLNGVGASDSAGPSYTDCDGDEVFSDTGEPALPTETEGQITYDTHTNPTSAELTYSIQNFKLNLEHDPDCTNCSVNPNGYLQDPEAVQDGNPITETVSTQCSASSGSIVRRKKK